MPATIRRPTRPRQEHEMTIGDLVVGFHPKIKGHVLENCLAAIKMEQTAVKEGRLFKDAGQTFPTDAVGLKKARIIDLHQTTIRRIGRMLDNAQHENFVTSKKSATMLLQKAAIVNRLAEYSKRPLVVKKSR